MPNINYEKFSVLTVLNPEDIKNIISVYIIGETGTEILVVTKNDKVFSFGINENGLLGLGHNKPMIVPTMVPELCGKQLVSIISGNDFALALTQSGHLYSWGNNSYGQLGNGSQNSNYKPIINDILSKDNVKVIDMRCGSNHSLILTDKGEVYSFGNNVYGQIGCANNDNKLTPFKLDKTSFDSEKIISISCGLYHSMALNINGHVFSWGHNDFGQLGIGNNAHQIIPIKIKNDIICKKISCGSHHSIILSFEGYIYTFGDNNNGQIGNGTKDQTNIPLKLENFSVLKDNEKTIEVTSIAKAMNSNVVFKDIASDSQSDISIATAMNGNCYVWGDCVNDVVMTPKETQFKSIHDVFAEYGKRKITYMPSVVKFESHENTISGYIFKLALTKPASETNGAMASGESGAGGESGAAGAV